MMERYYTIKNVNELLEYRRVMFDYYKPGVFKVTLEKSHPTFNTCVMAFCPEKIVKEWLFAHFDIEQLKDLIVRIEGGE